MVSLISERNYWAPGKHTNMTFVKIESSNLTCNREVIGWGEGYEVFELTISRSDPKVSCYWISCAALIPWEKHDVTPIFIFMFVVSTVKWQDAPAKHWFIKI